MRVPATGDDLNRAHVGAEDCAAILFRVLLSKLADGHLAVNQTYALPSCRIKVSVHGFEWFLYNKTAAYDHILSQMRAKAPPVPEESEDRRYFSRTSGLEGKSSIMSAVTIS